MRLGTVARQGGHPRREEVEQHDLAAQRREVEAGRIDRAQHLQRGDLVARLQAVAGRGRSGGRAELQGRDGDLRITRRLRRRIEHAEELLLRGGSELGGEDSAGDPEAERRRVLEVARDGRGDAAQHRGIGVEARHPLAPARELVEVRALLATLGADRVQVDAPEHRLVLVDLDRVVAIEEGVERRDGRVDVAGEIEPQRRRIAERTEVLALPLLEESVQPGLLLVPDRRTGGPVEDVREFCLGAREVLVLGEEGRRDEEGGDDEERSHGAGPRPATAPGWGSLAA